MKLIIILMLLLTSCTLRKTNNYAYEKAFKDIIYIDVGQFTGSGFQTKTPKNKLVMITNRHVCEKSIDNKIKVTTASANFVFIDRKIIRMSVSQDLCAIEPLLTVGTYNLALSFTPWEEVKYYGYPGHYGLTIFRAQILNLVQFNEHDEFMMLSNIVIPGNSGGPVVNLDEEVVGVITIKDQLNLGGFIPLDKLDAFLQGLDE